MKFIFIRHAESEANKAEVVAGPDSPLTLEGLQQADAAAREFSMPVDIIFSSPLKRALQTAEAFARKLDIPIKIHNDLVEKDYGSFAGKTQEDLRQFAKENEEYRDDQWGTDYHTFGGEAGTHVRDRTQSFIEEIKRLYPNMTILVMTHTVVIRMMHWLYGTKEQEHYPKIPNVSIHEFDL